MHLISVKPNKSQQFHEKMYTIQELNCMCIHISNLFMSFSKKITGILCESGNMRCINWIFLLMYVCIYITSSKKRKAFRKLVFRFSKIQVSKQNLFNSNANICISGKDVYLVLLLQGPPIQGYCFKIWQTHNLLHTLFFFL